MLDFVACNMQAWPIPTRSWDEIHLPGKTNSRDLVFLKKKKKKIGHRKDNL